MPVIETLRCQVCDSNFTRERKRGVKPKTCPSCKRDMDNGNGTKVIDNTIKTVLGKQPITSSRESYQAKIDEGISLYCAHPKDLGRLCEREGHDTNCTCKCHNREDG